MSDNSRLEARVNVLEERMDAAEEDARTARLLAAAVDRDIVTLTKKVDTNRKMINEATLQNRARFDLVDQRLDRLENEVHMGFAETRAKFEQVDAKFDQVDRNFAEVRARFDQLAGGMEQITGMLTILIDREDGRQ